MQLQSSILNFEDEEYRVIKNIGSGSFGDVKLVESKDNVKYALKIISKQKLFNIPIKYILSEIQVMEQIDHDYILKLIKYKVEDGSYYILLEFCEGGDLLAFIKQLKNENRLSQDIILRTFYQIIIGFNVLHSNHIIHRDIKPDNILIKDGIPKIADFGFSKNISSQHDIANTYLGTFSTMAPEIFQNQKYSYEVDIYSLGVLLYYMLYQQYPYEGNHPNKILLLIKQGKPNFPNNSTIKVDQNIKDLIINMIQFDKRKRPTIAELIQEACFEKYRQEFDLINRKPSILLPQCLEQVDELNNEIEKKHLGENEQNSQDQDENYQNENKEQKPQLKKLMSIDVNKFIQYLKTFEEIDPGLMMSAFVPVYDCNLNDRQNQQIERKLDNLKYILFKSNQYFHMLYQMSDTLKYIENNLSDCNNVSFKKYLDEFKNRFLCYFQVKIEVILKDLECAENKQILKYDKEVKQKYEKQIQQIKKCIDFNSEEFLNKSEIIQKFNKEEEQQVQNKLIQFCQYFNSKIQTQSDSTQHSSDQIEENMRNQLILSNLVLIFNKTIAIDDLNFNVFNFIIKQLKFNSIYNFIYFEEKYI